MGARPSLDNVLTWLNLDDPGGRSGSQVVNLYQDPDLGLSQGDYDFVMGNSSNNYVTSFNGHNGIKGNSSTLQASNSDLNQTLNHSWWIDLWTYFESTKQGNIFGTGTTAASQGLHIVYNGTNNSGVRFGMYSNDTDFTHGMVNGNWYHLAFSYQHSSPYTKRMWVDGSEITGTPLQTQQQWAGGSDRVWIGKSYGAAYQPSTVFGDQVIAVWRFYKNETASTDKVLRNYVAEKGRFK